MDRSGARPDVMRMEWFGREIEVHVGLDTDEYGQFCCELIVDGKRRYHIWLTDKSEES